MKPLWGRLESRWMRRVLAPCRALVAASVRGGPLESDDSAEDERLKTAARRMRSLARRVREVGFGQVLLIGEALCWLVAARVALRVVPVAKILQWQQKPVKARLDEARAAELGERVRHAVLVAVRYAPVEFVCFPQCLAASALLRRQGLGTRLHYGVAREAGRLVAHTWLESGGEMLIGGEVAGAYSRLGVYEAG